MKNFGLLKKSIISLCLVLGVFAMAFGAVTISNYYTAQKNACSLVAVQGSEEAGAETSYGGEYTFPSALETEKTDSSDSEIVFADEVSDIGQSIDEATNSKAESEEEVGVNFTIRFSVGSGGSASCWAEEEYYDIWSLSWKTRWNSVSGSRSCPATDGYYVYIKVKINSINSGYDYATFEGTRLYAGQTIYTFAYSSTSYSVSFGTFPTYKVTYYGNGNTSGSPPSTQSFKREVVYIQGKNTLAKNGYTFNGWNTSSSGSGYSYAVGEVYGTYANLNLYAQWKPNSYTIYVKGGSYGSNQSNKSYTVKTTRQTVSLPSSITSTNSSYKFDSWKITSNSSGSSSSVSGSTLSIPANAYGNITVTAQWKLNSYTLSVTKDSNISSAYSTYSSITAGSSTNIYATPKEGYYFKNWTISSGSGTFGSSTTANTTFKPTANSSIKANSAIETYTLKFDSNGGSACSDIKKTYDSAITLPTPTKECYTFKGWYRSETSNNGSGTQFTATKMPDLGNNNASVTLYAKWEVNKVDLTFNLDAGVSKIQYKINSGSFVNLTANKTVEDVNALSTIEVVASTKSGYTWSGFVFGANDKYNLTSGSLSALTFKFQPKGNITLSAKTFVNIKLIPASDMYGDYTENASGGSVGFSSSSLSGTTSSTTTHGGSKTIYAKPGYACTFLGFYSSLTKLNDSSTSNDADDNLNLNTSVLNGVRSATITNITTERIVYAVFKFITNNVNAYAYSSDGQTFGSSPDSVGGVVAVSGDTTPDATSTVAVRYTTETSVTATAKEGYKFIGWYDSLEALKNDTKNTSCISTDPIYTFNMPNSVVSYYAKFMKLFTLTLNYTAGISSFSVSGAESLAEKAQGATIVANTAQFYYGQSLGSIICNVDSVRYNWYKWEIASANAPSLINSQLSSAEIRNITMPNYDFALTAYASPKSFGLNVYAVYTDNGEYVVGNSRGGTVQINNETASASLTDFQVTYGTNFAHGTNNAVTITAKSNSNYTFVGWFNQITGTFEYGSIVDALSTNATMTIDKINEDGLSYYAVFVKNYNLYVYFDPQIFSINLTNSVIKSTSDNVYLQGTYYYGQPIPNLSAEIVAQGYKFKNWGVASGDLVPKNFDNIAVSTDGNSSNQANLFMCAGDSSLYPTFDYREYTLYLKANYSDTTSFVLGNQGGQIQIQSRSPAYNDAKIFKYKDKVTLLATPSEGYALYGWFKFNSSDVRTLPNDYSNLLNNEIISTPQITVDMDYQSITYIALFKKTYSLELSYSTGISSVSKTPEKDFYFYNEKVQIDATPTSGYADDFDVWIIASSSDTPSIFNESLKQQTITIQGNYEFIATSAFNYLLNYHIMTENPDGTFSEDLAGGDLTGLKNGKMVAGMNISSLVITNENFIFDWFYLDDNFTQAFGNKATNTAIMPAETLDVYLKFTRKTFTISIANFETLASDNSTLVTSDTKRLSANKYILRYQETAILSVNLKAFPGWELYGIYTDSRFANLHILGEDIFNPNTGLYTCDSLPANAENLTYYAMFKRITYDIGVNKSHDEISVNVPSTAYFGQTISFTCQMPIYLTGLSVSVTGPNSQVHLSNASGTYFFTMPSYAVTVNANADRPYVALTYDANGGSFGSAYVTNAGGQVLGGVLYYDNLYQYYSNIDKTATVNGVPVPQRIGYTFLGFANANNLKYVSFNPSNNQYSYQTFAVNEPTTLYAIWDISTPILKVDTLKAQTVEYNGEVQDVYKIVIENQAHDIGYIYTWTNDATGEVVSNTSVLSVLNVVDSGSYTCKVVAGDKWAEISAEIQITKKTMKVDVNDSITYLKGTQLALSDANLVGLLNVHTLQSGKLVFNDVDDIAIDITLKLKGTDTTSQKGINIVDNYDISLAKYLTVKEKASLFTINVANYERTIDDSTFQNIYSETVLGGSSVNLAYSKPLEVVTETLASGVTTNMIDDINVGGELSLGLSVPANYELVEVFVNGLAISSYIYSNNILAFVLNSEFVVDETCDIQIYFSKEALVTLHYNLNSSEISAGNAGYTSDKIIQTKGQAFIGPNQNTFFRNGFDFDGWYFTDSLALKVDGIWSIVGETNLYAKWNLEGLSAQNLTLTIKDNGNIVQSVNRAYNAKSVELSVAHIHPQVNLEISWLKDGISINKTANPLSIVNASESGLYAFIVTATFQGQSLEVVSSDIGLVANIKILKAQVDISSINFGITKVYDADTRLYNPQTRLDYYIFNTGVNNESMQLKGKYASPNVVINGTEIGDIQIVDLTFVGVNGAIVSNYSFVGDVYGKITPFAYIIDKRDSKVYDGQVFNVQYTGNSIVYPLTGIRHNIEYTLTTDSENAGFYTGNSGLYYNFVVKDSNGLIILSNNFTVSMSGTSSVEIMKADLANNLFFDNENLVYDTQTHMIYIKEGSTTLNNGQLPAGASQVVYKHLGVEISTGFMNAGSYIIVAEITGDHNHNNKTLSATLTIAKRNFSVNFEYDREPILPTYLYIEDRNMYNGLKVIAVDRTDANANIVPKVDKVVTFEGRETTTVTQVGNYTISLKTITGFDAQNFTLLGNDSFTFNIKELILGTDAMTFEDATYTYNARDYLEVFAKNVVHNHQVEIIATTYEKQVDGNFVSTDEAINVGVYKVTHEIAPTVAGVVLDQTLFSATLTIIPYTIQLKTPTEVLFSKDYGQQDPTLTQTLYYFDIEVVVQYEREEGEDVGTYAIKNPNLLLNSTEIQNNFVLSEFNDTFKAFEIKKLKGERNLILIRQVKNLTQEYDGQEKTKLNFATLPSDVFSVVKFNENGVLEDVEKYNLTNIEFGFSGVNFAKDCGSYNLVLNSFESTTHELVSYIGAGFVYEITPIEVTISGDFGKTYDGTTIVDTSKLTLNGTNEEIDFAGNYVQKSVLKNGNEILDVVIEFEIYSQNYKIAKIGGQDYKGKIYPREITVAYAEGGLDKIFDKSAIVLTNQLTLNNVVDGDIVDFSGVYADINSGSDIAITFSTTNENYAITGIYAGNITPYEYSAILTNNKEYDGELFAVIQQDTIYFATSSLSETIYFKIETTGSAVGKYPDSNGNALTSTLCDINGEAVQNSNIILTVGNETYLEIKDRPITLNLNYGNPSNFVDNGQISNTDVKSFKVIYGTKLSDAINGSQDLPTPSKVGYKFGGWFLDASNSQAFDKNTQVYGESGIFAIGNLKTTEYTITLYAKWTIQSYNITIKTYTENVSDDNFELSFEGGEVILNEQALTETTASTSWQYYSNASIKISPNEHFVVDDVLRNGVSIYQNTNNIVFDKIFEASGNIVFEIKLAREVYNITINKNPPHNFVADDVVVVGTSWKFNGNTAIKTLKYGQSTTLPELSLTGQIFNGYSYYKSGIKEYFTDISQVVSPTTNIDFEAVWNSKTIKIYFNFYGGTLEDESGVRVEDDRYYIEVEYGNAFGTLPTPVRAGYVFAGYDLYDNGVFVCAVTETTILSNDSTTLVLAGTWEENTNNVFNISKTLDRTVYGSAVEGVGYEVFDSNINVTYAVNNIVQMTTLEFTNNSTSFTNVATNSVVYVKYTVVNFAYKVVGWEVDGQQLVSGDNEINDVLFNVNDNILAITNFTWGETAPQINIVYEPNEVTIHTELANADYANIDFANANGIFEENGLFKTYAGNLTTIQLNTKPSREVVDFGVENATLVNFASAIEDDYLSICDIVSDFTIKIAFDYTPFDVEILNIGEHSAVSIEYALNQGSFETLDGAITTKMTDVINVRIIINWGYELKNSNWNYDPSLCTIGELSASTTADNKTIIETQISNYEKAFSVEINPTKRTFNAYAQVGVLSNNEIQITESTNNTANVNISSAEYLTTLTYTATEEIEGVNVGRINVNQKVYTFVGWYEYKNLEFVEFGDNNKSLTLQTTMLGDTTLIAVFERNTFKVVFSVADSNKGGIYSTETDESGNLLNAVKQQTVVYGDDKISSGVQAVAKIGYDFVGWKVYFEYTDKNGAKYYADINNAYLSELDIKNSSILVKKFNNSNVIGLDDLGEIKANVYCMAIFEEYIISIETKTAFDDSTEKAGKITVGYDATDNLISLILGSNNSLGFTLQTKSCHSLTLNAKAAKGYEFKGWLIEPNNQENYIINQIYATTKQESNLDIQFLGNENYIVTAIFARATNNVDVSLKTVDDSRIEGGLVGKYENGEYAFLPNTMTFPVKTEESVNVYFKVHLGYTIVPGYLDEKIESLKSQGITLTYNQNTLTQDEQEVYSVYYTLTLSGFKENCEIEIPITRGTTTFHFYDVNFNATNPEDKFFDSGFTATIQYGISTFKPTNQTHLQGITQIIHKEGYDFYGWSTSKLMQNIIFDHNNYPSFSAWTSFETDVDLYPMFDIRKVKLNVEVVPNDALSATTLDYRELFNNILLVDDKSKPIVSGTSFYFYAGAEFELTLPTTKSGYTFYKYSIKTAEDDWKDISLAEINNGSASDVFSVNQYDIDGNIYIKLVYGVNFQTERANYYLDNNRVNIIGGDVKVTSSLNSNYAPYGEDITVTAIPEDGYRLAGWVINGVTHNNITTETFTYNLTEPTTFKAIFIGEQVKVAFAEDVENGKGTRISGGNNVAQNSNEYIFHVGDIITMFAEANVGYDFLNSWLLNDNQHQGNMYLILPSDANEDELVLVPQFELRKMTIRVVATNSLGNIIIPDKNVTPVEVDGNDVYSFNQTYDKDISFNIKADTRYQISEIKLFIDSEEVSVDNGWLVGNSWTLTNGDFQNGKDIEVRVFFEKVYWYDYLIQNEIIAIGPENEVEILDGFGGSGSSEDPYKIETLADLVLFSYVVNYSIPQTNPSKNAFNSENTYYEIMYKLDLKSRYWTPIGTVDNPFNGKVFVYGAPSGLFVDEEDENFPYDLFDKSTLKKHANLFGYLGEDADVEYTKPNYSGVYIVVGCVVGLVAILLVVILIVNNRRNKKIQTYNEDNNRRF